MTSDRDTDAFLRSGGALGGPLGEDLQATLQLNQHTRAGALIGPYRIVRELGRGGMGTVYLAERADDAYRKLVAIKVGARGGWSLHAERRFREERQILAGLEHINIARLLDGGSSAGGMPFLVMEFVDGVPIDVFCDQRRLSTSDRLRIFRSVCAAVQYAHQRLIVHRDIKPSNVLVTADGTPKLLDFGIAKLLAPDGEAAGEQTVTVERVFTPEYASPEQITGRPVTTATDVYQLGVLLYQLLTGRRPYRLTSTLPHEIAAAICEQDAQRPSVAISRTDTTAPLDGTAAQELSAEAVSMVREGAPERLRRRLQGDLDAIVLTTLRKDPEQRYGSAEQLSDDIGRHLDGLPVAARAESGGYRLRRLLWRHRIAFAAAAIVVAALVIGLGVATWQAGVARSQRARAEAQETRGRRLLYAAQMNLAGQDRVGGHAGRTVDLLDAHVPAPGAEDLRGFEWYYLWKAAHAERRTFSGAFPPVAFSPDGATLATSDDAETPIVHLWDTASGRHLAALAGHTALVTSVEFSPDGTLLVSASEDRTARLWRTDTRAQVALLGSHALGVTAVTFDPAGNRIATTSDDATTKVWSLDGRELATLKGDAHPVKALGFSRDGLLLATGSEDATVRIWDTGTWRTVDLLSDRRPGTITAVLFSPDRRYLATTGVGWGGIAIWDLQTRQLLPLNYNSPQFCAAFSPGGDLLATGGHDRVLLVWNLQQQRMVNFIRGHSSAVDAVRFSPDGKTVATASRDGSTRLWDVTVQQGPTILRPPGSPRAVAFSPDGRQLAVGTGNGVGLWDTAAAREKMSFPLASPVLAVAFFPDGRTVAALDLTSAVHVLNVVDGSTVVTLPGRRQLEDGTHPAGVAFAADGRRLAAAADDDTVRIWNIGTWQETLLNTGAARVSAVAFSPDGRLLATAGLNRTPRVHDLTGERPPVLLQGHTDPVLWIGFTSDGSRIVTSSFDGTVRFWDQTGREAAKLSVGGDLGGAVFTPDNRRLIVAGLGDPSLAIFDTVSNELLQTLRGHGAPISGLAISPDGTTIASTSNEGTLRLWRAATADQVAAWKALSSARTDGTTPPPR